MKKEDREVLGKKKVKKKKKNIILAEQNNTLLEVGEENDPGFSVNDSKKSKKRKSAEILEVGEEKHMSDSAIKKSKKLKHSKTLT